MGDDIVRHSQQWETQGANGVDEFQCEVRKDLAEQYAQLSEWSIEEASRRLGCPVLQKGEADIGNNWTDTH